MSAGGGAPTEPTEPDFWQPGSRLSARVGHSGPRRRVQTTGRDPRLVAAAIVTVAVAIALALWLVALWVRANQDDVDPGGEAVSAPSTVTVLDMTAMAGPTHVNAHA